MNIFVLDENPRMAAQYHCDRHVSKMILESAQMICAVAHRHGVPAPYKLTHKNHPCTKWVGESSDNLMWLWELASNLEYEWQERYRQGPGKMRDHKSMVVIDQVAPALRYELPSIGLTPFALAMPEEYRSTDVVKSYRSYYREAKQSFATWKLNKPYWWK